MKTSKILCMLALCIPIAVFAYYQTPKINKYVSIILEMPFKVIYRKDIIINGASKKTKKEIESILSGYSLLPNNSFDFNKVYEQVASLPWISHVEIKNKYPTHCVITIIEEKPYAVYFKDKKLYLISKKGKILNEVKRAEGYVIVSGEYANTQAYTIIDALSAYPGLLDNVREIILRNNRRWDIIIGDAIILLPEINIHETIELFYENFYKNYNYMKFSKIDLRIIGKAYTSSK